MLNLLFIASFAFAEEVPAVEETKEAVEVIETEEQKLLKEVDAIDINKLELVPTKAADIGIKPPGTATPVTEEVKVESKEPAKEVEVPEDYNEAAETVSLLVKAVQDKNWALAIGLLLTLLVFVANKFGLREKVGSKAVPWIATGLATVAALGVSLANGLPVTDAISQGILAGLTAIGGWEMLFKHVLAPKKVEEQKEG